jgi:hypothetical protein
VSGRVIGHTYIFRLDLCGQRSSPGGNSRSRYAISTKAKFDRDELALNYANLHFDVDEGVREIYHLPQGAPPREIRLLEVNSLVAEIQNP